MIRVGHVDAPSEQAQPCITCARSTTWRGIYEPLPTVQLRRPLCCECVEVGKGLLAILSNIRKRYLELKAG